MKHKNKALVISHLSVAVQGKQILNDVSLTIKSGHIYAVMGPNGSGKSTLAYALMGHPGYDATRDTRHAKSKKKISIVLGGKDITNMPPEERAKAGLFLTFQAPISIPGVSVMNILRSSFETMYGGKKTDGGPQIQNPFLSRRWTAGQMSLAEFTNSVKQYAEQLRIDESLLSRGINDGFSGGEKKKIEMLQALILRPKFAVFDEIDTGLDVDALATVAGGIALLVKQGTGVLVITHYRRILRYVKPVVIHVLVGGMLVDRGDATLARTVEQKGYASYVSHTNVRS